MDRNLVWVIKRKRRGAAPMRVVVARLTWAKIDFYEVKHGDLILLMSRKHLLSCFTLG